MRDDSAFYQRAIIAEYKRAGAQFTIVMDGSDLLHEKAKSLQNTAWKPFAADPQPEKVHRGKRRREQPRCRRKITRRQGCPTLATTREWVAEFDHVMPRRSMAMDHGLAVRQFRVIVNHQLVEVIEGQDTCFEEYRHRFIITNIP